jgi:DNA-binding NtrC family response regulator
VGGSTALDRVREALAVAAVSGDPVMIRGESGVGKSLAARVLLAQSRSAGTVVRLRCGRASRERASEQLSELARSCAGGRASLFLDDVGDAPIWLQEQIGERMTALGVDSTRIVAATSRDLERLVTRGRLHPDFVRLIAGTTIWVPPLRVRRGDVGELVHHFLEQFAPIDVSEDALACLASQAWPDNVRQLQDITRRLGLLYQRVAREQVLREITAQRARADATGRSPRRL